MSECCCAVVDIVGGAVAAVDVGDGVRVGGVVVAAVVVGVVAVF